MIKFIEIKTLIQTSISKNSHRESLPKSLLTTKLIRWLFAAPASKSYAWFLCLAIASTLTSCGVADEKKSTVNISLPSQKLSARNVNSSSGPGIFSAHRVGSYLERVIIYVRGQSVAQQASVVWEACRDCGGTPPAPPSTFSLNVAPGASRLIQVLAVYTDNSGYLEVNYGDSLSNLTSGNNNINLTISPIGLGGGDINIGQIAGRYVDSADAGTGLLGGPSGRLNVSYVPPGKPEMIIDRTSMANGWFSALSIQKEFFKYALEGGPVIFPALNIDSLASTSQIAKINIPSHVKIRDGSTATEAAQTLVLGWFAAPGLSIPSLGGNPRKVCYQSAGFFRSRFTDTTLTTHLTYGPTSGATNEVNFQVPANHSACALPTDIGNDIYSSGSLEYLSTLAFRPSQFDNGGKDSFAGIDGYLKSQRAPMNGFNSVVVTKAPDRLEIGAEFMPGAQLLFDSFSVLLYSSAQRLGRTPDGGADCQALISSGAASERASVNMNLTTAYQSNIGISAAEYSGLQNPAIVICPKKLGVFAARGRINQDFKYPGDSLPQEVTHFMIRYPSVVGIGGCYKGEVLLTLSSGNLGYNSETRTILIASEVSPSIPILSNFANCGGLALNANVTIPAGKTSGEFFYTYTATGTSAAPTLSQTSGSPLTFFGAPTGIQFSTTGLDSRIRIAKLNNQNQDPGGCSEFELIREDAGGYQVVGSTFNANISGIGLGPSSLFTGILLDSCSTQAPLAASQVAFTSGDRRKTFAVVEPPSSSSQPKYTIRASVPGANAAGRFNSVDFGMSNRPFQQNPNLKFWLKPMTGNNNTNAWFSSHLSNDFNGVTGGGTLAVVSNGLAGHNTMQINTEGATANWSRNFGTNGYYSFSVSMLVRVSSAMMGSKQVLAIADNSAIQSHVVYYNSTTSKFSFDAGSSLQQSSTAPADSWHVVTVRRTPTDASNGVVDLFVNGAKAWRTATAETSFGVRTDYIYLGSNSLTSFKGEYAEVIGHGRNTGSADGVEVVSDADVNDIYQYFKEKYPAANLP
jgi:hypothetical protein